MPYSNYYKKSNLFHGSAINIMGTRLDAVMFGQESLLSEVWQQIISETERLYRMLNRFDPLSDISHINRKAKTHPVEVNDELWHILTAIKQYHHQTLGYFDISLRDFKQVVLDDELRTVTFADEHILLDMGGYGKGYALERIREILLREGVTQALVNFGDSSMLALGSHPHGDCWHIGIENPFQPGKQLKICELRNQSLSVSGNSVQHTGHIMNPRTGIYNTAQKTVSVVSANATEAEVLSTALMVADENAISHIKKFFCNTIIDIFAV